MRGLIIQGHSRSGLTRKGTTEGSLSIIDALVGRMFGTRAIAKSVPLDVIQAQMGHASIQTTTNSYGHMPTQRWPDELGKVFS